MTFCPLKKSILVQFPFLSLLNARDSSVSTLTRTRTASVPDCHKDVDDVTGASLLTVHISRFYSNSIFVIDCSLSFSSKRGEASMPPDEKKGQYSSGFRGTEERDSSKVTPILHNTLAPKEEISISQHHVMQVHWKPTEAELSAGEISLRHIAMQMYEALLRKKKEAGMKGGMMALQRNGEIMMQVLQTILSDTTILAVPLQTKDNVDALKNSEEQRQHTNNTKNMIKAGEEEEHDEEMVGLTIEIHDPAGTLRLCCCADGPTGTAAATSPCHHTSATPPLSQQQQQHNHQRQPAAGAMTDREVNSISTAGDDARTRENSLHSFSPYLHNRTRYYCHGRVKETYMPRTLHEDLKNGIPVPHPFCHQCIETRWGENTTNVISAAASCDAGVGAWFDQPLSVLAEFQEQLSASRINNSSSTFKEGQKGSTTPTIATSSSTVKDDDNDEAADNKSNGVRHHQLHRVCLECPNRYYCTECAETHAHGTHHTFALTPYKPLLVPFTDLLISGEAVSDDDHHCPSFSIFADVMKASVRRYWDRPFIGTFCTQEAIAKSNQNKEERKDEGMSMMKSSLDASLLDFVSFGEVWREALVLCEQLSHAFAVQLERGDHHHVAENNSQKEEEVPAAKESTNGKKHKQPMIGLCAQNSTLFVITDLALALLGVCIVPLPRFASHEPWGNSKVLRLLCSKHLSGIVTDSSNVQQLTSALKEFREKKEEHGDEVPQLLVVDHDLLAEERKRSRPWKEKMDELRENIEAVSTFEDRIVNRTLVRKWMTDGKRDEILFGLFPTSGSSGLEWKLAQYKLSTWIGQLLMTAQPPEGAKNFQVSLQYQPLTHFGARMATWGAIISGGIRVLSTASEIIPCALRLNPTQFFLPPVLWQQLHARFTGKDVAETSPLFLDAENRLSDLLKFVTSIVGQRCLVISTGAGPIAHATLYWMKKSFGPFCKVHDGYGSTELGATILCNGAVVQRDEHGRDTSSFSTTATGAATSTTATTEMGGESSTKGRAAYWTERDVKLDEQGNILVKAPFMFDGYFDTTTTGTAATFTQSLTTTATATTRNEIQKKPFTEDGYFRTGDVGRWEVDPETNQRKLVIAGRQDSSVVKLSNGLFARLDLIEKEVVGRFNVCEFFATVSERTSAFVIALASVSLVSSSDADDDSSQSKNARRIEVEKEETEKKLKKFFAAVLEPHEIPVRILVFDALHDSRAPCFSVENDLLTTTFKKKRRNIASFYQRELHELDAQVTKVLLASRRLVEGGTKEKKEDTERRSEEEISCQYHLNSLQSIVACGTVEKELSVPHLTAKNLVLFGQYEETREEMKNSYGKRDELVLGTTAVSTNNHHQQKKQAKEGQKELSPIKDSSSLPDDLRLFPSSLAFAQGRCISPVDFHTLLSTDISEKKRRKNKYDSEFRFTILLTGATGFVGSHLLLELLRCANDSTLQIVCPVRHCGKNNSKKSSCVCCETGRAKRGTSEEDDSSTGSNSSARWGAASPLCREKRLMDAAIKASADPDTDSKLVLNAIKSSTVRVIPEEEIHQQLHLCNMQSARSTTDTTTIDHDEDEKQNFFFPLQDNDVDVVICCAAHVDFSLPYEALRTPNVLQPAELSKFFASALFVLISSTSVDQIVAFEMHMSDAARDHNFGSTLEWASLMRSQFTGYNISKYMCERAVLSTRFSEVGGKASTHRNESPKERNENLMTIAKLKILRIPFIWCNSETGKGNLQDSFHRFVMGMIQLGCAPGPSPEFVANLPSRQRRMSMQLRGFTVLPVDFCALGLFETLSPFLPNSCREKKNKKGDAKSGPVGTTAVASVVDKEENRKENEDKQAVDDDDDMMGVLDFDTEFEGDVFECFNATWFIPYFQLLSLISRYAPSLEFVPYSVFLEKLKKELKKYEIFLKSSHQHSEESLSAHVCTSSSNTCSTVDLRDESQRQQQVNPLAALLPLFEDAGSTTNHEEKATDSVAVNPNENDENPSSSTYIPMFISPRRITGFDGHVLTAASAPVLSSSATENDRSDGDAIDRKKTVSEEPPSQQQQEGVDDLFQDEVEVLQVVERNVRWIIGEIR